MSILYGIPYMVSKTKIAPYIIEKLPAGERFVDLFGGGFAVTHCAMLSGKWERFYYNDINPLLPPLIKRAICGEYNYNRFKPKFITREEFERLKDKDGYIGAIWAYANNIGKGYMYNADIEPLKHEAHDFVVFGKPTTHFREIEQFVTAKDINKRRLQFGNAMRARRKRFDLQHLEGLERLQHLEGLGRLQQLERLSRNQALETLNNGAFTEKLILQCGSYESYEYRPGDAVYCDPPYEGTSGYGRTAFDHAAFYEWVRTRPYQVFFSSYTGVQGFKPIWAKQIRSGISTDNNFLNFECLYTNR